MKKLISLLTLFIFLFAAVPSYAATAEVGEPTLPEITAGSAISVDIATGEIILTKEPTKKMYPASLTKMMTALILAENRKLDDVITITDAALAAPPFAINTNLFVLYAGDTITVENCLDAMLMASANDMAIAAAVDVGGDVDGFVKMMNAKAKALGMKDTHFTNPVGLHDDNHYSTAYDLSILLRAAYANPVLKPIMGTKTKDIRTQNQDIGQIEHTDKSLGEDGNVAGKTGYTEEAGTCLATVYQRDGREIAIIVLHSDETFGTSQHFVDTLDMANASYAMKKTALFTKGEAVDPVVTTYKLFRWFGPEKKVAIKSTVGEDMEFYNNTLNSSMLKPVQTPVSNLDVFKLKKGDKTSDITLDLKDSKVSVPTVSESSTFDLILVPNAASYLIALFAGLLLLILLIYIISRVIRLDSVGGRSIKRRRQERRRRASRKNNNYDI